jgi:hypothetical protein
LPGGPAFILQGEGISVTVVDGKAPETAVLIRGLGRAGTPSLQLVSYALEYHDANGAHVVGLDLPETPLLPKVYVPATASVTPKVVRVPLPLVSDAVVAYGKQLQCAVTITGATDQDYEVHLTTEVPIFFK